MKLVKPSFKILDIERSITDTYKKIEYAGRICYNSVYKITDDSYASFVDKLKASRHNSPLEAGGVYLKFDDKVNEDDYCNACEFFNDNPYSRSFGTIDKEDASHAVMYVSTNYRVIIENELECWLKYFDSSYIAEPRISVVFTTSRGVMDEYFRHRTMSMSAESSRYCNYSKDKFGNELTFIDDGLIDDIKKDQYKLAECAYMQEIKEGKTAQYARNVLPLGLKSTYILTGFIDDWEHFFDLRDSNSAYPEAHEIAHKLKEEFINKGYIKIY